MPLHDDLLKPIAEENPSGVSLRYDPVYDKIKEARRQEEDLAQGIWERSVKRADYGQVIQLARDALAKRSKDLQLAAWLTEALAYKEGIGGLCQGLVLIKDLLEQFWDTLHPELEDGDPFMRTGILDWIGSHLDDAVKSSPLTRGGLNWYQYKESRALGYEADCAENSEKLEARNAAINEGKIPAEQFDEDFDRTPKAFYVGLKDSLEASMEALRRIEEFTDQKFTEEPPSFSGLRSSLEDLQQTAHVLLAKKREQEPDEAPEPQPGASSSWEEPAATEAPVEDAAAGDAPAQRAMPAAAVAADPVDREDAIDRVVRAAAFLRREDLYSPVPYLMLRALRWGELRAGGQELNPVLLEAPPSEIRQQIKRCSMDGQWEEVIQAAETAMSMPCGRGWLDLQRYVIRACTELGSWYDPVSHAVQSELRALLADYPSLPDQTLMDDTPTANAETRSWLSEIMASTAASHGPSRDGFEEETPQEMDGGSPEAPPDSYDLAMQALRSGRADDAISLLTAELAQVKSGRDRFRRRVQLAQVCLAADKVLIAFPILQDLAAEIERRRLEEWEAPELVAHPLVLLFRCLSKLGRAPEEKQAVYERICRLDPVQAMACAE